MSLPLSLSEVLDDRTLKPFTKGKAILREKRVMEVNVLQIPASSAVLDINRMGRLKGMKPGVCEKRCDYLVVSEAGRKNLAVFVELKKTLDEDVSEGMNQLRQSRPLLDYLQSVCRIHVGRNSHSSETIIRYCLLGEQLNARIPKESPKVKRPWRVEMYRDIKVATFVGDVISFDELCTDYNLRHHP